MLVLQLRSKDNVKKWREHYTKLHKLDADYTKLHKKGKKKWSEARAYRFFRYICTQAKNITS